MRMEAVDNELRLHTGLQRQRELGDAEVTHAVTAVHTVSGSSASAEQCNGTPYPACDNVPPAAICRLLSACTVLAMPPSADFSVHVLSWTCRHRQTSWCMHCPGHTAICRLLGACTVLAMPPSADFSVHVLSWPCRNLQTSQCMYYPGHASICRLLSACTVLDMPPSADFSVHVLSRWNCRHLQTSQWMYFPGHAAISRLLGACTVLEILPFADFSVHVLSWTCRRLAAICRLLSACTVLTMPPSADFSVHCACIALDMPVSLDCQHLQILFILLLLFCLIFYFPSQYE